MKKVSAFYRFEPEFTASIRFLPFCFVAIRFYMAYNIISEIYREASGCLSLFFFERRPLHEKHDRMSIPDRVRV